MIRQCVLNVVYDTTGSTHRGQMQGPTHIQMNTSDTFTMQLIPDQSAGLSTI